MEFGMSIGEEVASIVSRLEIGTIRLELAKSELHYLIEAAATMEELNAAYAAYNRVGSKKAREEAQ